MQRRVSTLARKSGGMPTVRWHVLIMRPRVQLTGVANRSRGFSHEMGSLHHERSDLPRRINSASIPAAEVCSKHVFIGNVEINVLVSKDMMRCGDWSTIVLIMPGLMVLTTTHVSAGTEWACREQHHCILSSMR